jgi:hypothetical protein
VRNERLFSIINPNQQTGITNTSGCTIKLAVLIRKLPINACSEAFGSRYISKKKNNARINNVNAKCDPFNKCVSFQELINNRNINIGRNVRVLIIVYLLLNCASKKALSSVIIPLNMLDNKEFGRITDCMLSTMILL